MRPPGRRRTRPEALGSLVPGLLEDLGFESVSILSRIVDGWEAIVGTEAARHARPSALRGRSLEVEVDGSVWAQTLRLRSPAILAALARELGTDAPAELWLRLGGSGLRPGAAAEPR